MATIDLGKIAITPEGKWSAGKYYEKLSLVIFNGQSYLSLRDTTGDNPETSRSDWMQITSRGESLYQMMVREGKFVGTEEEFTQQYLDSLKACADASDEVRSALSDILDEMDRIRAEISEVMVEEDIRIKNEAKRESAEINRKNADITRGVAERNRQEAEQRREQSMQQIQNDAEIALAMAAEAQQKAEEAILNEEERISAENQRKIDEATRIQHEEQRVNDEAMRRSREADRQESENIRQKNEGDRILAEREREEIMRNLAEELKALAAKRFKIVDVLPEVGESAVIYLVPSTTPSDNDVYDEWAYVSEKWERIGSTRFEIDNYFTKEEVEDALATKANIQHQHTVADITDFPELYYDATEILSSATFTTEQFDELYDAILSKKIIYTYNYNNDGSYLVFQPFTWLEFSSRVIELTAACREGNKSVLTSFILYPYEGNDVRKFKAYVPTNTSELTNDSGFITDSDISGKADKATTLAGYGIGDAYTKSEVDTALEGKQDTLTAGNGISIEGNVISSSVAEVVDNIVNAGYVFAGVATPATDPSTPNAKVFYIANGKGTYEKFGGIEVTEDEVVVLKYDTAWHKVATGIASDEKLSELERDFGKYEAFPNVALALEQAGKRITKDGEIVADPSWNIGRLGAVMVGNTYELKMESAEKMVLGTALFVSRTIEKRGSENVVVLTPLFSAMSTDIPRTGYVCFEAMEAYEDVLVCYRIDVDGADTMLVRRYGTKASIATQINNLKKNVDLKSFSDGYYESMRVGTADNLTSKGVPTEEVFTERVAGGTHEIEDGDASIKSIKGNTIVWNQQNSNPNLENAGEGYVKSVAEVRNSVKMVQLCRGNYNEISDKGITVVKGGVGELLISGTSTGSFMSNIGVIMPIVNGHKYIFVHGEKTPQSGTTWQIFSYADTFSRRYIFNDVDIKEAISTGNAEIAAAVYNGISVNLKLRLQIFDLTEMFGAGFEPSTHLEFAQRLGYASIDDIPYIPYTEGTDTATDAYVVKSDIGKAEVQTIKGRTDKVVQLIDKSVMDITMNGVSIINNNDGTYTVNGTATGGAGYTNTSCKVYANHRYFMCGCPKGGSSSTYKCYTTNILNINELGNGAFGTTDDDGTTYLVVAFVANGATVTNLVFRPQLFDLTAMGMEDVTTADEFARRVGYPSIDALPDIESTEG